MPFRRFFAARGVAHPVIYSNALLALLMTGLVLAGVGFSLQASKRSQAASEAVLRQQIEEQRLAFERDTAAREEARRVSCIGVLSLNNVYQRQLDELSPPGREIAEAWKNLASLCK